MQSIFLESHHLKNQFFGFGQFNYHLIKSLAAQNALEGKAEFILNIPKNYEKKKELDSFFKFHTYRSRSRYRPFRPRKRYDLWHSLNQNTKVEPYYKMPYLLTVHDLNFMEDGSKKLTERKNRFEEKICRANAIVYISNYAKARTHKYFDIPDIPEYVIYNGNPIQNLKINENYKPNFLPKKKFFFSIGEFLKKKNFHVLVKMMSHLSEYDLILAGKSSTLYADEIKRMIKELKLKNRVHVTGKISEEDKYYYYNNAEAFLFPSLLEGFGIPPIEAMTFGTPVFLSNRSSLPEIGGKSARYWNNFDAEYMAEVVKKGLLEFNKDKSENMKKLKNHASKFDWNQTAKEYIDVYKSILESK